MKYKGEDLSDRLKKIKILEKNLLDLNLNKESKQINFLQTLHKIAIITDEDESAKADWYYKAPEEKKKILDTKSVTPEQASELAHQVLDTVGLAPGIGEVADLINSIMYTREGKYGLAAISLLCLIPAIGTAVGIAKKSGVTLSAKIFSTQVFEHAVEIEKIVRAYERQVPNGEKVSEAVRKILSDIRMGADGIDLTTGLAVKTTSGAAEASAKAAIKGAPLEAKWYLNPKWKEWLSSLIQPNLIKILNQMSETEARDRLAKILTQKNSKLIESMKVQGIDSGSIDILLRENAEIAKFVSDNFAYIIQDLKQNMRYRILLNPEDIPKFTSNTRALAHANLNSNEIVFFLPRFESVISRPSEIIDAITNTIRHETWHIIDGRLAYIFTRMESKFLSELDDLSDAFKIITQNLNSSVVPRQYASYITEPRELFVRIRELRHFIGKNVLTAEDLKQFAVKNKDSVPLDLRPIHDMMQRHKNWRVTYKALADAMNKAF